MNCRSLRRLPRGRATAGEPRARKGGRAIARPHRRVGRSTKLEGGARSWSVRLRTVQTTFNLLRSLVRPWRSQRSFRRVFSGTAHEIMPALRLARPERVRARLDPIAYFKHGEWRHLPTLARPTTSRSCAKENEARGRRARGARPLAGAAARARPTTGGVMHCNATSEKTIVCGRGQIPAAF